jgi:hypothetical protein
MTNNPCSFYPRIPKIAWSQVQVEEIVVFSSSSNGDDKVRYRATISEPRALSGFQYSVDKNYSVHSEAMADLLSPLQHAHIPQVHAMGEDFLVLDLWEETLRQRMQRYQPSKSKSTNNSRWGRRKQQPQRTKTIPQLGIPIDCLNVWTQVALPVTRALLYLHGQSICYNAALSLDTIVFADETSDAKLYLIDFSKAALDDDTGFFDVFSLGQLLQELAHLQPLLSPGQQPQQRLLQELVDVCCHKSSSCRPSIRRVHKRLLEFVRLFLTPTSPSSLSLSPRSNTTDLATDEASHPGGNSSHRSRSCPTKSSLSHPKTTKRDRLLVLSSFLKSATDNQYQRGHHHPTKKRSFTDTDIASARTEDESVSESLLADPAEVCLVTLA